MAQVVAAIFKIYDDLNVLGILLDVILHGLDFLRHNWF